MIWKMCSFSSELKMITSSTLFKNSGEKVRFNAFSMTALFASSALACLAEVAKPTPSPKLTPLPQNINSSKKVLIMMPNIVPVEQQPVSTSSVEEINDGDGDTNDNLSTILDEELEEELKELDEQELEKELENEENENEENQQTSVHEIIDDNE